MYTFTHGELCTAVCRYVSVSVSVCRYLSVDEPMYTLTHGELCTASCMKNNVCICMYQHVHTCVCVCVSCVCHAWIHSDMTKLYTSYKTKQYLVCLSVDMCLCLCMSVDMCLSDMTKLHLIQDHVDPFVKKNWLSARIQCIFCNWMGQISITNYTCMDGYICTWQSSWQTWQSWHLTWRSWPIWKKKITLYTRTHSKQKALRYVCHPTQIVRPLQTHQLTHTQSHTHTITHTGSAICELPHISTTLSLHAHTHTHTCMNVFIRAYANVVLQTWCCT